MKKGKTMSKIAMAILALCICTSCGQKGSESGKVSLRVGGWPANEGAQLDQKNEEKAKFEAENEDIEIIPDTWSFDLQTFYPKAESGQLPDLYTTHFTEFKKVVEGGYASDLTKEMKNNGIYDNLNPKLKDIVTYDGKIYAMPVNAYALGLHYNTKLFEQAGFMDADGTPKQPKDWYELAEMAKTIKKKTGVPGFVLETSNNCGGWFFTNIGWSFGVSFMEQGKDGKWKATFNTPEAVEALQFIKDLKWKYDCVPSNSIIDQQEAQKLYCTGGAAMALDGPMKNINKYEMDVNDFGLMALPAGPKKHVALLGGTLDFVANDVSDDVISAAFKWLSFIGVNYTYREDSTEKTIKNLKQNIEDGMVVGVKEIKIWSDESEKIKKYNELVDQYCNINPNHVRLYNESLVGTELSFQAEEPVCAQDLYGILDGIIQEVFTNKDADCAALIKQANDDFQKNYLDKMDY